MTSSIHVEPFARFLSALGFVLLVFFFVFFLKRYCFISRAEVTECVAYSRTLGLLDFEDKLRVWNNVNQRDGHEKIKKGASVSSVRQDSEPLLPSLCEACGYVLKRNIVSTSVRRSENMWWSGKMICFANNIL